MIRFDNKTFVDAALDAGLTAQQISLNTGMAHATVRKVVEGEGDLHCRTLSAIAEAVGLDVVIHIVPKSTPWTDVKTMDPMSAVTALSGQTGKKATHNLSKSRAYQCWSDMKQRCLNPARENFKHYGGRGITVCDRWRYSFQAFLADMGEPPPGLTINRKNNDGNYEPDNCHWATWVEQANNKRPRRGKK